MIPDIGMPMNWPKLLIDPTIDSFHWFSVHMISNYKTYIMTCTQYDVILNALQYENDN